MRIAYITWHWPRIRQSGIGLKIQSQMNYWEKMGHTTQLFMHLYSNGPESDLIPGKYFYYQQNTGFLGRINSEFSRIWAAHTLIQKVAEFQPDLIFMRWAMYVFPLQRIFNIAPVVVEINTNDVFEHRLLGPGLNLYNQIARGITLANASGLVCASHELATAKEFNKYHKSVAVISNGIDLSNTPVYPAPNNPIPRIIFIGSPGMAWHGVEKLVDLAEQFQDLKIEIVGYDQIPGRVSIPCNITLHGYLHGKDYESIMAQSDIAIGTLSLYKKNMNEASPLKIRDCLAHGLPVVLPYKDTDLDELDDKCVLKIPNSEDNIMKYGQSIHDFAYYMRGKRFLNKLILSRINSQNKERQRLIFFESILESA